MTASVDNQIADLALDFGVSMSAIREVALAVAASITRDGIEAEFSAATGEAQAKIMKAYAMEYLRKQEAIAKKLTENPEELAAFKLRVYKMLTEGQGV